jgi:hypothetical protein
LSKVQTVNWGKRAGKGEKTSKAREGGGGSESESKGKESAAEGTIHKALIPTRNYELILLIVVVKRWLFEIQRDIERNKLFIAFLPIISTRQVPSQLPRTRPPLGRGCL